VETTTEIVYAAENANDALLELIYSNSSTIMHLLESINAYIQVAFILIIGLLLYKFLTAFIGT